MEARIRNSEMQYSVRDGVLDLYPMQQHRAAQPSMFLIEGNVRPPNVICIWATTLVYGVNYNVLHLLFALADTERLEAMARLFMNGATGTLDIVLIPVTHGGVFDSDDPCEDLYHRWSELETSVWKSGCLFKRGEIVPDLSSGTLTWIAYFLVYSTSREEALVKGEHVRSNFEYQLI